MKVIQRSLASVTNLGVTSRHAGQPRWQQHPVDRIRPLPGSPPAAAEAPGRCKPVDAPASDPGPTDQAAAGNGATKRRAIGEHGEPLRRQQQPLGETVPYQAPPPSPLSAMAIQGFQASGALRRPLVLGQLLRPMARRCRYQTAGTATGEYTEVLGRWTCQLHSNSSYCNCVVATGRSRPGEEGPEFMLRRGIRALAWASLSSAADGS